MKKLIFVLFLCVAISCEREKIVSISTIVDFPAAYVVCSDNSVAVINLNTMFVDTSFLIPNAGNIFAHHIYKSPDNQKLVIATPQYDFSNGHAGLHGKSVKGGFAVLDAKTGQILNKTETPEANHNAVFTNDGKEIWTSLVSHSNSRVQVYNATDLSLLKEIAVGVDASEIVLSLDGSNMFVAAEEGSFVYAIDVNAKKVRAQIKVDFFPTNVWVGAGDIMYVENKNKPSINFIDAKNLHATSAIDLNFKPGFIAFDEQNKVLWVCNGAANEVVIFQKKGENYIEINRIKTGEDPHSIAFSTKQKIAFVVNQKSNTVTLIDLLTLKKIKEISTGLKPNGMVLIE